MTKQGFRTHSKLISAFVLVMVLFGGGMGIYHYAVSATTSGFEDLMSTDVATASLAGEVKALMLQCRRNEKDFLLRLDKKYLDKIQGNLAALKQAAEGIAGLAEQSGNAAAAEQTAQAIAYADQYGRVFERVVSSWERKGLDHKSGLQGKFRAAAHVLADAMPKHRVGDLHVAMLQIRRYEKDYALTSSEKYKAKFMAAIETFNELLAKSSCSDETKRALEGALTAYAGNARKYVAADKGADARDEIYARMKSAAHDMEGALTQVYVPNAGELLLDIRKNEKDYLLRGDEKYVAATHRSVSNLLDAFKNAGLAQDRIDRTEASLKVYGEAFNALVKEDQTITATVAAMRDAVHNIEPLVKRIHEDSTQVAATRTAETTATAHSFVALAVAIGIGSILGGLLVAILLTRSITKPFKEIFKGLKTFSKAELKQTGETFNRITQGLTESGAQVNDAAAQVSSASQQLAEGASEQASSLEETSGALEQMAAMTRTNAANAKEANGLADETHKAASEGERTMTAINESSDQISKIIKVIEEIAFQTNLLALNAAVEAARAGEHGKGFAVVADEVRNLAQRAAQAARETTGLIEDSVNRAREGGTAIQKIVSGVAKVTGLLNGIAQASNEQAQGVEQVNTAVSQMDKVTQQNASGAEESAAAAEELSAQAQAANGMVNQLVALTEGNEGGRSASRNATAKTTMRKHHAKSPHPHKGPHPKPQPVPVAAGQSGASPEGFMSLDDGNEVNEF